MRNPPHARISSEYDVGPRRIVRIYFRFSPPAIAEIVKVLPGSFLEVRERYFDQWVEYVADKDFCEVIPVIRAHRIEKGWIWHAVIPGLLADGMHASMDIPYEHKADALMAGLEKYPTGVVA